SAVTASLTLPTTVLGQTIDWSSSAPEVVSPTGAVTRPTDGDRTVVLTATVSAHGSTVSRDFTLHVPRALTPQQQADEVAAGLVVHNLDDARGNLTLPTTGAGGAVVTWASADPAVVTPT